MTHCVPDFETDEDYLLPASSSLTRPKRSAMADEDIMELLWQNGQVVMQSQNQRSAGNKKSETMPSTATREVRSGVVEEEQTPSNMFMQEDEMASWLHYPSDDNSLDLYLYNNDILYPVLPSSTPVTTARSSLPPPPPPLVTVPSPRPPIPPFKCVEDEPSQPKYANFLHFSRPNKGRSIGSAPSSSNKVSQAATQSTVVESNESLAAEAPSRASRVTDSAAHVSGTNIGCPGSMSGFGTAGTSSAGREPETCELSTTSSPCTGGSGASASVEPSSQKPPPLTNDRKRKGRDTDDTECYSEDVKFEHHDAKKQSRGSTSTKRSRAAEVHNLSERRRRDRINEKMKALQELIPRCNKSDKASMLDEAIEYLKSLQMQVQIMSMGYSMVPMMFPGVQRYMPTMPAMGMGIGMDHVGTNRAVVPYPAVLPGSALPNSAAAAAHLGQRFPVPRFHIAPVPVMGPARSQTDHLSNPMMNSYPPQNPNQPRVPNFANPYQQHLSLQQTQLPQPQNQTVMPPVASKPINSKDVRDPEHQPTGKPGLFG